MERGRLVEVEVVMEAAVVEVEVEVARGCRGLMGIDGDGHVNGRCVVVWGLEIGVLGIPFESLARVWYAVSIRTNRVRL